MRRGRSYSPRSRSSSSRSYSRSPSRSRHCSPYRYRRYYSRSPRRYRSRSPRRKDCRVYVSNLSFDTTWHHLKDFMREAGQVAHVDILKLPNGRSKGCGVVEYRYPEDAKRAIHTMNNVEFMGRPVYIRHDRDFEYSNVSKDSRDVPDECRLYISNLPLNASWQDIKDLFRRAGRVLHTDIHTDNNRRPTGHGTVIFDEARFARHAIDMFHGYEWQGHTLEVKNTTIQHHSASSEINTNTTASSDMYRHNTPTTLPLPPPPPPPPPPLPSSAPSYNMSFIGGPAANLPTHGHNQIFVNNLPFSTTWQDLIDLFRHVGPVVRSEILTVNGHPKGSGFVRFEDASTCERAIDKFNGYMYGGRQLDIRLDKYSTTI